MDITQQWIWVSHIFKQQIDGSEKYNIGMKIKVQKIYIKYDTISMKLKKQAKYSITVSNDTCFYEKTVKIKPHSRET